MQFVGSHNSFQKADINVLAHSQYSSASYEGGQAETFAEMNDYGHDGGSYQFQNMGYGAVDQQ